MSEIKTTSVQDLQRNIDNLYSCNRELTEENKALHSEVLKIIDDVGKRDVYIDELRMEVQQQDERLDRSREHVERLQGINKDFSKQLDEKDNHIRDLESLINDLAVIAFQYNYNEDKGYSLSILNKASGHDEKDSNHMYWLNKFNKVLGYEVKDND